MDRGQRVCAGMTQSLLERVVEVMSRAAVGHLDARVDLPEDADLEEPLVVVAQMLDVLLEDLRYREQASREAERRLAQSEAKEQFLATISHEIRTPVSVVIGMTEALQSMELDQAPAGCVEHLAVATDHLHALIDDVLDFSRLSSEGVELRDAPFDIVEAASQCVTLLADQSHARGIHLTTDTDVETRRVIGDSRRVRQVIINLLSNAIKHTPGGSIHLEVTTTQRPEGVALGVSVTEAGGRPVIIGLTANAFEQDRQACLAAGMDHFIAKPARLETLGAVLETPQVEAAAASPALSSQ